MECMCPQLLPQYYEEVLYTITYNKLDILPAA